MPAFALPALPAAAATSNIGVAHGFLLIVAVFAAIMAVLIVPGEIRVRRARRNRTGSSPNKH